MIAFFNICKNRTTMCITYLDVVELGKVNQIPVWIVAGWRPGNPRAVV